MKECTDQRTDNSELIVNDNKKEKSRTEYLFEGMAKLNNLIGLDSVKMQIRKQISRIAIQQKADKLHIGSGKLSSHMAFLGNPGSGKTETARCLGDIFYGIGVTKSPIFLEVSRCNLVGPYIGHTEDKTKALMDEAVNKGCTLFIDEFHQLYSSDESRNDFGKKAIDVLVSYLENRRNDFVCIIAGYPQEMREAINSDQGLQSRFNIFIDFPDYNLDEMCSIFKLFCRVNNHFVSEIDALSETKEALHVLREGIAGLLGEFKNIGNGRAMRKLYEKTEMNQAMRLYSQLFTSGLERKIGEENFNKEFMKNYAFFSTEDIEKALEEMRSELRQFEAENKTKKVGFIK